MTGLRTIPRRAKCSKRSALAALTGVSLFLSLTANGRSQELPPEPSPVVASPAKVSYRPGGGAGWLFAPYETPIVQPSPTQNSSLVSTLIHDGQFSLTLRDAIQLTIENNFDVEIQRYNHEFAQTEILRARGGGSLRGVPTTVSELVSGEGGPGEPLLTTVGGYSPVLQLPSSAANLATITGTQSDLSILSPTPYSSGPIIPQFDPYVAANIALAQQIFPQSNAFATGSNYYSSHSLSGEAGYTQGFSTGTIFNASLVSSRLNEASTRLNINPFITSDLNVTLTQPLLQGFGIHVNRRFIHIASNEDQIAQYVFTQQLISTISDMTRLYWDLVSLQQDLEVKRESLLAAERLYTDTKNEVDLGTKAPVDLTSAQAMVASNRQAYINSKGMVLQQELLLKEILTRKGISDPELAAASIRAVTPIESPRSDGVPALAALLQEAITQRPDLKLAQKQMDSTKEALKGSRNALLPQLNLVASIQNNGGAGSAVSPSLIGGSDGTLTAPPSNLIGGYGATLGQIFKRDYPDYTVGASLNIPIHNRVARADAARDELQYRQSEVRVQQLQSQVRLQVGNAMIAVQQAREAYDAAAQALALQEQALDVEREKFEAGIATILEFMQFQNSLAEAKSACVSALGVYAKAKTALQRATASTLVDNNVTVEDAYANRVATTTVTPARR